MSDFDKLNSQFDLKNVDAASLTKALSEHQNSFIKLILIIGSLLMVGMMFNDHHAKDQALRNQMSQVREKLETIKGRDKAIDKLDKFKSHIAKRINVFQLITLISDYAKSNHLTIVSFSPSDLKDMGLYDTITVNFSMAADNFKDVMLFLRKTEKSHSPVRVDSWSGREGSNGKITFETEITAVLIHT